MIRKIDGRIVVDDASYFQEITGQRRSLPPLNSNSIAPRITVTDGHHDARRQYIHANRPWPEHTEYIDFDEIMGSPIRRRIMPNDVSCYQSYGNDVVVDDGMTDQETKPGACVRLLSFDNHGGDADQDTNRWIGSETDLTEEQLLLCNTHVRGYSLKQKCWAEFDVDKIRDIAWNDDSFPALMLPGGYKDLISTFVKGQATHKNAFDDIVEGKGLGMVMLLVGNPGTGKTLSAEAIADKLRKPLYILSAGELGYGAEQLEKRLTTALALTEKWDAVLLFDECDVFLQQRSSQNLVHNEIVAVFLRLVG